MKVTFFHRKPFDSYYSIENIFKEIRKSLCQKVDCSIAISPFPSRGVINRIKNILAARKLQRGVCHITGDIHYLAIGMKKAKTLLTIHDCEFMQRGPRWKRKLLQWLWLSWPIKRVALVSTISEYSKQDILKYVNCPESKIKVIHNFVSPRFQYVPKIFNSNKPTILQIGTKHNKNLPRLIKAIEGIPCLLDVVGPLSNTQKELLKKHKIEYSNSSNLSNDEIVYKYENCDLLAFTSTFEGFGLPIVEANAIGRVVVTSNTSSMPEVAGNAAHLVNPFDVKNIRQGIVEVIKNESYRNQLIQNGLKNVERFQLERIANEYLNLYKLLDRQDERSRKTP